MKLHSAAAIALLAASPAFAAGTLVDFETVTGFASLNDFYNGGTDSAGNSGPNLGVSFGGDALGLVNDVLGPYFSHAPSPIGVMTPVGPDATMNFAAGFVDAISFAYSSTSLAISAVNVYTGLNGTGTLLASFNLTPNAHAGCNDSPFCHFDFAASSFFGTAHSVTFGNAANVAAFDNVAISFPLITPGVPEPASALMLALGVVGVLAARRRA